MPPVQAEEICIPVDEILRFLYGHKHHLFEHFVSKWSPSGRLTYGKVPSLLFNSIVLFAYNYRKQCWVIADDQRTFSLCASWTKIVMSHNAEIKEDSFLDFTHFVNIVKLLEKKQTELEINEIKLLRFLKDFEINEIKLYRTLDPTTTHDYTSPSYRNFPPPEIKSDPPLHSHRKFDPFDAIVSYKDHPKGGDADPGAEVFINERHDLNESNESFSPPARQPQIVKKVKVNQIDRHDLGGRRRDKFSRKKTQEAAPGPRRRHAIGAQVRHKRELGAVSVSASRDKKMDEIVRNSHEKRTICDFFCAAGFDPYVKVSLMEFSSRGPRPELIQTQQTNPVSNVNRACQWTARDANVMKFRLRTDELENSGLRLCILDEEFGSPYFDQRLGGVMLRVGEHLSRDDIGKPDKSDDSYAVDRPRVKTVELDLAVKRRRRFAGILKVYLSAKFIQGVPRDECMLELRIDTATKLKKDRGDESVDGTTAFIYLLIFIVYLVVVGYVFKFLEADVAGARIKTWSDGFWFAFITATTVGYGDFYPISDAGLYVNCFVILMDVLFLGYITSVVFDMVVGSIERKEQIRKETGGRDLLSDLSFFEFLYSENTNKRWTSQEERELREHQKKVREYDFGGQRVMVEGDFSEINMHADDVIAKIEDTGAELVTVTIQEVIEVEIDEETNEEIQTRKLLMKDAKGENEEECNLFILGRGASKDFRAYAKTKKKVDAWSALDFRDWTEFFKEESRLMELFNEWSQIITFSFLVLLFVLFGCLVWVYNEDFDLDAAVHFCFVSMSTVGYGDIAPVEPESKWFCAFYILAGVGVLAKLGSLLTDRIMENQAERITRKIAEECLMHPAQLIEMDMDGKGELDKYEFMRGLLLAMGKARLADFRGMESRFREIDVDEGGTINRKDFELAMKRRKTAEQFDQAALILGDQPTSALAGSFYDVQEEDSLSEDKFILTPRGGHTRIGVTE